MAGCSADELPAAQAHVTYTITTDEPPEHWCRPLYEGQTIEVTTNETNRGGAPITRRYTAAYETIHRDPPITALIWVPVPVQHTPFTKTPRP